MSEDHFSPLRQSLYDQFNLCRYVVPVTVNGDIEAPKFLNMKREGSRTAHYIQAVSRVLKHHPRVNSSFVRKFWTNGSKIVQWKTVDAAVAVDRKFGDERYPFTCVLHNSDRLTVKEIDEILRHHKEAPIEEIPAFANYLRFLKLPWLVRRVLMHKMICDEALMRERIGTFNFTNLSFWHFRSAAMPTPRLLVGVSAPAKDNQSFPIGYCFNHVIADGAQIGEFHRDLQRFFRKCDFD